MYLSEDRIGEQMETIQQSFGVLLSLRVAGKATTTCQRTNLCMHGVGHRSHETLRHANND